MQKLPPNVRFWSRLNSLNVKWSAIIHSANPDHACTRYKIINKMDKPISLINTDTSCILFVTASLIYVGTFGFNPHYGYIYYIHETSIGDSCGQTNVWLSCRFVCVCVGGGSTFPRTSFLSYLLFWHVMQHTLAISYRHFGTNLHCVNIPEE